MTPVHHGVDFSVIAADQLSDPDVIALRSTHNSLKLEEAVMQEGSPAISAMSPLAVPTLLFQWPLPVEVLNQFTPSHSMEFGH